jgi:hypothetical protein
MLAKIQPTLDTDPVPTPASNAILAGNFTINMIEAEFADRQNIQPYLGNAGKVAISQKTSCSFEVELQSAGAAGTAPAFAPLLRACAMAETIVASTTAAYNPITTAHEMITLYYYLDGILCKMLNCKGTFTLQLSAGGIPSIKFTFTGSFSTPTDTANPAGSVFTAFKQPLGINKINSPTFTLHGTAFKAQSLDVDIGNQVLYRNLIGYEAILITDRSPSGSCSFETESVATKDWYTIIKNGTLGALQLVHGTVAGLIVQIDAPKVQLVDPQFSDSDGVSMFDTSLQFLPNTGNDELVLTFK